jgi:hypothetical protein
MRYNVKWRADGTGPLQPEKFDSFNTTKERVRNLFASHGRGTFVEVWNEDETWQIVTPAGAEEWSRP